MDGQSSTSLALTPRQSEGPYFKPGSPEKSRLLEPEDRGRRLRLEGRVLTPSGRPLVGAKVDFWHADENGRYDHAGYRHRGHQFTGEDGRYYLETVVPAAYSTRAPHVHARVTTAQGEELTTQLYFPGAPRNRTDRMFDERLLIEGSAEDDEFSGSFDFVLAR